MKKFITLFLLLALTAALVCGCTPRKPPSMQEDPAQEDSAEKDPEQESAPEPSDKQEDKTEKEEEEDEKPMDVAQSGTFLLMDSKYEITVKEPFVGIFDPGLDGFYISAEQDDSLQGIVSYTTGDEAVQEIEDNIANLNQALKNDSSVFDFAFDRQKEPDGLYNITFTYATKADDVSTAGFQYVYYKKTPGGMLTVMFNCPHKDFSNQIMEVFHSVMPATDKAAEPPRRAAEGN